MLFVMHTLWKNYICWHDFIFRAPPHAITSKLSRSCPTL